LTAYLYTMLGVILWRLPVFLVCIIGVHYWCTLMFSF